jgi:hypothetical protein
VALLARAAPPDEDVAFIADLMSLPESERHPLPSLSPQRKKERTLEALIRHLEGLARQTPVVMVLEDAHWIDPTSHELLDLAVERVRSLQVLLIVTLRPEFQPPWIRGDARFADAGLAGEQHNLAVSRLGARPAAQQQIDLFIAADQPGQRRSAQCLEPTLDDTQTERMPHSQRARDTIRVNGAIFEQLAD